MILHKSTNRLFENRKAAKLALGASGFEMALKHGDILYTNDNESANRTLWKEKDILH